MGFYRLIILWMAFCLVEAGDDNYNGDIVRKFFFLEGLNVKENDNKLFERYPQEAITKMKQTMVDRSDAYGYWVKNAEINSLIYKSLSQKPSGKSAYELLLDAIDLMVPGEHSDPIINLAKEDLRKFYSEQEDLGSELLGRLFVELESTALRTSDLLSYLKNFYFRWIPLGRLGKFIDLHAKNS